MQRFHVGVWALLAAAAAATAGAKEIWAEQLEKLLAALAPAAVESAAAEPAAD